MNVSNLINIAVLDFNRSVEYAQREIKLIYVLTGKLKVKINRKEYDMKDSDFILVNSNELHSIHSEENNLFITILIDYSILSNILNQKHLLFMCNSIEKTNLSDQSLRRLIRELLYIFTKQDFNLQRDFNGKAFQIVSILILNYLSNKSEYDIKRDMYGKGSKDRLGDIVQYIDDHYQQPLSLEEVAMQHFITVPYLSKYFKKHTGKNFLEYLNEVRLVHAVNELLQSNKSIINIALDNGFPTLASFNRVFSRHYQLKPAEYRRNIEKSLNNNDEDSLKRFDDNLLEVKKIKRVREYLDTTENNQIENNTQPYDVVQKQTIKVDKVEKLTKYWNKLINIGYAKDVLKSDMQEQIILMQNELKFTYARVWGLFSDEMMIVDHLEKEVIYNFSNTNKVLDFFVKNKLIPFIELGPKPKIISKNLKQTLVLNPLVIKPNNEKILDDYKNLISAFLLNCVERYGVEEVERWYFEIWNYYIDPFQDGNKLIEDNDLSPHIYKKYFKDFALLKMAIKDIVPTVKVGGCGLQSMGSEVTELFLSEWKKESVNPDFLSVYIYSYSTIENQNKKRIPMENLQSTNPDYVQNALEQLRRTIKKTGYDNIEINVTEWNTSISNRDFLNDSCFKACYIVKNLIDNINPGINMMGYWLSSDIFSDYKDSKNLIYGGAGLVTRNGIKKPSYYSFVLLKYLGDILVARGENYIVTKKTGNQYQVLCFNYKHFNYSFYMHPEGSKGVSEQYDIFENNETLKISLALQGVKNGKYRIKEFMLNRNHGSILDKWLEFGATDDIKQDEVDYLKQICMPLMKVKHAEVSNFSIVLNGELEPHEVKLFELNLIFGE